MEENEVIENVKIMKEDEEAEVGIIKAEEVKSGSIMSFADMKNNSKTISEIYTNIKDKKLLFNLENKVDFLLNDCEDELIKVKGIIIRKFTKPMKNPEIDEETGEILKDTEISMATVLLDENGKSYATGSKIFGIQLMRFIDEFGVEDIEKDGLVIRIIKKEVNNGKNKALAFELV